MISRSRSTSRTSMAMQFMLGICRLARRTHRLPRWSSTQDLSSLLSPATFATTPPPEGTNLESTIHQPIDSKSVRRKRGGAAVRPSMSESRSQGNWWARSRLRLLMERPSLKDSILKTMCASTNSQGLLLRNYSRSKSVANNCFSLFIWLKGLKTELMAF